MLLFKANPMPRPASSKIPRNSRGRMTVLAFLTERASVKKVLEHLGLPTTGPPVAKARSPVEFDFAS